MKHWATLALAVALACPAAMAQHAEGQAEPAESEAKHKDLGPWKWANFLLLVGVLGYIGSKAGKVYFNSRSEEIQKGIADAQRMRAEAESRSAEMEKRLGQLGADIEALRKSAREEAAAEGERIRQETKRELAKVQANARREMDSAILSARKELKNYSADLALDLAKQKLRNQLTPQDQHGLVRGFVRELSRERQVS